MDLSAGSMFASEAPLPKASVCESSVTAEGTCAVFMSAIGGEPPVRFWALTLRKRTFVHQASSDRIALSIGLLPSNALIPKAAT